MSLYVQRMRIATDPLWGGTLVDSMTWKTPEVNQSETVQWEIGIFYGGAIQVADNVSGISMQITNIVNPTGFSWAAATTAIQQVVTNDAWNLGVSGTSGASAQHAVIILPASATTLLQASDADLVQYWVTINAQLFDGTIVALGQSPFYVLGLGWAL